MNKIPIILSWSGGKDCSYSLHLLRQQGVYEVQYLLSTFDARTRRLNMHGIHENLIQAQAVEAGIPLVCMYVENSSNHTYEEQLAATLQPLRQQGIYTIAYGDIFLEDIRQYRQEMAAAMNMQCLFPLWHMDSTSLLQQMIQGGFRSRICCVQTSCLPASLLGATIDDTFPECLPADVDACGENGEYHSFCYAGPIFSAPIPIKAASGQTAGHGHHHEPWSDFRWLDLALDLP